MGKYTRALDLARIESKKRLAEIKKLSRVVDILTTGIGQVLEVVPETEEQALGRAVHNVLGEAILNANRVMDGEDPDGSENV